MQRAGTKAPDAGADPARGILFNPAFKMVDSDCAVCKFTYARPGNQLVQIGISMVQQWFGGRRGCIRMLQGIVQVFVGPHVKPRTKLLKVIQYVFK